MPLPCKKTATCPEFEPGSMGLPGFWKTLGNASAMVILAGAFLWLLFKMDEHAHEDRALCREQIHEIRLLAEGMREELQFIHKQLRPNGEKP
jgi:hypothetical protein